MAKRSAPAKATRPAPHIPPSRVFSQNGLYYWKPGRDLRPHFKTIPLGASQHEAFAEGERLNRQVDDWRKAKANREGPKPRRPARQGPLTVAQISGLWRSSAEFPKSPTTAAGYRYILTRIETEFGHDLASTLDTVRVDDALDAIKAKAPETARHICAVARNLFNWAGRRQLIARGHNPFAKANAGGGNRRSARFTWDDLRHAITACETGGYPSLGGVLLTNFVCVQRVTDVIALTRANIAGGRLRFHQSKSTKHLAGGRTRPGFAVDMALPTPLADWLMRHPPKDMAPSAPLFVCETTNAGWHEKTISRVFARCIKAYVKKNPELAHLQELQLRDGRRSGFVHYVLLWENDGKTRDAAIPFICSMSGHQIAEGYEIIEHYLPRTAEFADIAVAKLLNTL